MRKWIIGGTAAAVVAVGAILVAPLFLPEKSVQLEEDPLADASPEAMQVASGTIRGEDGHSASGRVELVEVEGRYHLQFIDLKMTAGPDIYLYLTPSARPDTDREIDAGLRIAVVTDADPSAKINERGTFAVALPEGIDVSNYEGIGVWCDRFGVAFATAALSPG